MKLSTRIRTARLRAGLSQAELAEKLGVSRSAVANWERNAGGTHPGSKRLADIAINTGVAWEWLATGRGHATPSADHILAVDAEFVEDPIERRLLHAFRQGSDAFKQALLVLVERDAPLKRSDL